VGQIKLCTIYTQGNGTVERQGVVLLSFTTPKRKYAICIHRGSKKWEGGACAGGPHHISAKNGTSRSCYAADRGELWQQGRNTQPCPSQ